MIKNESDIIESFVRHNLFYVEELHIILQHSIDNTRLIIDSLINEGLNVILHEDADDLFNQGQKLGAFGRLLLSNSDCKLVVLLDADEFIKAPSAKVFRDALLSIPDDLFGYLHWESYVPTSPMFESALPVIVNITSRLKYEHQPTYKVILTKRFLDPNLILARGSHRVYDNNNAQYNMPVAHLRHFALAHFPVRSKYQIVAKAKSNRTFDSDNEAAGFHLKAIRKLIESNNIDIDFTLLQIIAADYQFKSNAIETRVLPELTYDPLPCSFELKYSSN